MKDWDGRGQWEWYSGRMGEGQWENGRDGEDDIGKRMGLEWENGVRMGGIRDKYDRVRGKRCCEHSLKLATSS